MNKFAEQLQGLMQGRFPNQQSLADAVGVSQPTVQRWLNDGVIPKGRALHDLCKIFGVQQDYFFGDSAGAPDTAAADRDAWRQRAHLAESELKRLKNDLLGAVERSNKRLEVKPPPPSSKRRSSTGGLLGVVAKSTDPSP